ncbi:MAG: Nif3-like dinuclear metal center hexameric protein [Bacteroidales bacterium]|jgi:dinuclear metal center YbgI/SA1388 family protein|nr:Nif3-like dinuclear metal center hexameric protein [Bacteroidales bacterium]
MTISEVIHHLENKFPLAWQEDFDNCGVQCGDRRQEIKGALVCFDVTENVVDEAIAKNKNFIVSHHPLIFGNGLKKIEPTSVVGRIICKALKNDLLIYSMHTNVDAGEGGGNDLFAQKLQLENVELLTENECHTEEPHKKVGLGRIGYLPEAMLPEIFYQYLKKQLNLTTFRVAGNIDRPIKKVALCGGSGGSFIKNALAAGADIYISGDIRYHDFLMPDNQMIVADIGHFESEHFIREIIFAELKENFTNFAPAFSEAENARIIFV